MAVTQAWDETAPASGDNPRDGDNEIRDLKQALRERLRNGGHLITTGTDVQDGRHVCGEENASGGPGTPLAGEWYIYAADQTTRIWTLSDSTAASARRILVGDGVGGSEQFGITAQSFTASDFTMSGAGTADFSAGSVVLPTNTVHQVEFSSATSNANLTGSFTTIDSDIITTAATAGPVLIMWHGTFTFTGGGTAPQLDIQILRDPGATVVATFSDVVIWQETNDLTVTIPIMWVDTGASNATATTYSIQAQEGTATNIPYTATTRPLILIELRNDV